VLDKHVELLKRRLVEQKRDPLPRRQLTLGVLGRDSAFAAAEPSLSASAIEFFENDFHVTFRAKR
jgi:hypothetical protein